MRFDLQEKKGNGSRNQRFLIKGEVVVEGKVGEESDLRVLSF